MKTALIYIFLVSTLYAQEVLRTWTNTEGKQMKAMLQGVNHEKAKLLVSNGKVYDYPISELSADDQLYIQEYSAAKKQIAPEPERVKLPVKLGRESSFRFSLNQYLPQRFSKEVTVKVDYIATKEIDDETAIIIMVGSYDAQGRRRILLSWEEILEDANYIFLFPDYDTRDRNLLAITDSLSDEVSYSIGIKKKTYYLYGNQSGADHIQQQLVFYKGHRIGAVSMANADTFAFPHLPDNKRLYKLKDNMVYDRLFSLPVKLLVGEELDKPGRNTAKVPDITEREIGDNLISRNQYLLDYVRTQAKKAGDESRWEFAVIPNISYHWTIMAEEAFGFFHTTRIE